MTVDCRKAREMLHERLDGQSTPADDARLERHLGACGGCRSEAEQLEALRAQTSRLPRTVEPRRDLWAGIERRLESSWRQRWRSGTWFPGQLWHPASLAAAAAVVALGLGLWLWRGEPLSTRAPDATRATAPAAVIDDEGRNQTRAELARFEDGMLLAHQDLLTAVQSRSDRLSPETQAAVEENMRIIDQAIGQIRTALEEDPLNQRLNMQLAAQYQHEVHLLKRVSGV